MKFSFRLLNLVLIPLIFWANTVKPLSGATSSYDVIVVGGDVEGVAAAVSAARAGVHTLLIDTRPILGGLLTRGWLNTIDLNLDRHNCPLNGGIFAEIFRQLDDQSFDVSAMEGILARLVAQEKNLDVMSGVLTVLPMIATSSRPLFKPGQTLCPDDRALALRLTTCIQPDLHDAAKPVTLSGVEVYLDNDKSLVVAGSRIIDATQDADLAVAAGADWSAYGEDVWGSPRNMATTLVFRLSGITDLDWHKMCEELCRQSSSGKLLGGKRNSIWGFGETMQKYSPLSRRTRMRGLNLGRQKDGSVLVNALLVFEVDGLNPESRVEARSLAEAELPVLLLFLQKQIPGMGSAQIAGTAPELYVRTSRQIKTLYTLSVDDVLENRDFSDKIGFGSYPLDIQAQSLEYTGDVTGKPEQYAVPLRCLVPVGFTNLLVAGRSAGFDSLAQSSARTVPVGMAAGQGAGVAAAVSIKTNMPFNKMAFDAAKIIELQGILLNQGVKIVPSPARPPAETSNWAYPGLQFLRRKGQISGGYANEYGLDKPMLPLAFVNRLAHLRDGLEKSYQKRLYGLVGSTKNLTLGAACMILANAERFSSTEQDIVRHESETTPAAAFQKMQRQGLFSHPWPVDQLDLNLPLTRGAGFMLLKGWDRLSR